MTEEFHYINLTVPRTCFRNQMLSPGCNFLSHQGFHLPVSILWIKPVGRPQSFSSRQFCAYLKASVNRRKFPFCIKSSTCVFLRSIFSDTTAYREDVVLNINFIREIVLQLIVLTGLTNQNIPFGSIQTV